MRLENLLAKIRYERVQGELDREVTELVFDSRKACPGCLFVALTGARSDGHDYIGQVMEAGAAAIVAERLPEQLSAGQPAGEGDGSGVTILLVEDSRRALAELSAAWFGYPAEKLTTIGITGTKGKTTTAVMVKRILEAAGEKVGLIGTLGAFMGQEHVPTVNTTPESYDIQRYFARMVEAGCRYAVMEVSSQGLKMHRVDGFTFDYGIFTNISPDHIGPDEHASFEEYLYYKSQLLKRCRLCAVNRDDEHFDEIVGDASCELVTFGMRADADYYTDRVDHLTRHGFMGIAFHLTGRASFPVEVNIPGLFNVYNAMAASALCLTMGVAEEAICRALQAVTVDGRMEIVYASEKLSALVDYAHNAVSMESLLATLRAYQPKRLVCVFGCGGNRSRLRRYEMGEIGGRMADLCIITADNSRWEKVEDIIADIRVGMDKTDGQFVEIPDRREAICYSIKHAQEGDIIAVIGKGHEDYQEICGVRTHFLDREELKKALIQYGYMK